MWTIVLLTFSNIFMTFAWYGHLKFRQEALWKVILVSWALPSSSTCSRCRPTASALPVFARAIKGDPGDHHADGLRRVHHALLRQPSALEPRRCRGVPGWRCFFVFHSW